MSEEKTITGEELTLSSQPAGRQGKHSDSYREANEPAYRTGRPGSDIYMIVGFAAAFLYSYFIK